MLSLQLYKAKFKHETVTNVIQSFLEVQEK